MSQIDQASVDASFNQGLLALIRSECSQLNVRRDGWKHSFEGGAMRKEEWVARLVGTAGCAMSLDVMQKSCTKGNGISETLVAFFAAIMSVEEHPEKLTADWPEQLNNEQLEVVRGVISAFKHEFEKKLCKDMMKLPFAE